MNRFRHLMAIFATFEGDGAGGGGGAKPPDKTKELEETVLKMVNAAVTSQLSRKLEATVATALETALTPILARLETTPKPPEPNPGPTADPAMAALQAQVEALTNQINEKDATSAANTEKHREEQLVAQIREGLSQGGVRKELLDGAVATVRSKILIDKETGAVTYQNQKEGWVEPLTLDKGLKTWGESTTGKAHMAPVAGGGAGTAPVGGGITPLTLNPATLPQDPKARQAAIKAHKVAAAKVSLRQNAAELIGGGKIQLSGQIPEGAEG